MSAMYELSGDELDAVSGGLITVVALNDIEVSDNEIVKDVDVDINAAAAVAVLGAAGAGASQRNPRNQ